MSRQQAKSRAIPKLSHEQVVGHLLEYQFGRLDSRMNAAVEDHIRQCRICQKQGLSHASTEKRAIERRVRRLRPKPLRRLISRRGRNTLLVLSFIAIVQVAVISLVGGSPAALAGIFSFGHPLPVSGAVTPTPTMVRLTPTSTLNPDSATSTAAAVSPDGKTIATAELKGSGYAIVMWNSSTGTSSATLAWPGSAKPVSLAWSPDGTMLSGADAGTIAAWNVGTRAQLWNLILPSAPALRVYDVQAGDVTQRPDPEAAFADGALLKWGSGGQLQAASLSAAGPTGVPSPGGPVVGLWRSAGSHIFADGKGGSRVGISPVDAAANFALLDWSPDGRYLLWASNSQPIAVPASTNIATPGPTATSSTSHGVPVPDAVVGNLSASVAASGHGDALVWFAPDGKEVAVCDRSAAAGALRVYATSTGRVLAELANVCAQMQLASLSWMPGQPAFVLVTAGKPVAIYRLGAVSG